MFKHPVAIPPPGTAPKPGVFHGSLAWFSEGVSDTYKRYWTLHGGEVGEAETADHLFAMTQDAPDVQELSLRLESKDRVFLCPRYIIYCILIGRLRSPKEQHILGSEQPRTSATQRQGDEKASTRGPSQSSTSVNAEAMVEDDQRARVMPSPGHEFGAAIAEIPKCAEQCNSH
ncbi:hypothetical protein HPB51_004777 [Rhipicephalus microplus]|uniref:BRCT domain-containing protein n=1 Tax=Rhipicephalus microplus TaxID=6941 RepID=A0A9J6E619_RHIMP|nr:hypothetical protein HPB51_004777 [Rhipicephalus microplus]